MMEASLNDDQKAIEDALNLIDNKAAKKDLRAAVELLVDFECYSPAIQFLEKNLSSPQPDTEYILILARIYGRLIRSPNDASRVLSTLVKNFAWGYAPLSKALQTHLIEVGDYTSEALILQELEVSFQSPQDTIEALQRICHIYEKKIFNDRLLNRYYQKLRDRNPGNKKALRYFKMLHSQHQNWGKAHEILLDMLKYAIHPNELAMIGLELAALQLYQMGRAKDAIQTIGQYCQSKFLDTSVVLYDAYAQTNQWEGCLTILRSALSSVEQPFERSVLYFRMGHHLLSLEDAEEAERMFRKSLDETPLFLDSLDQLTQIALSQHRWDEVEVLVRELKQKMSDSALIEQVDEALARLVEARAH